MKIRTYVADNVQEAFYKVKSELGKDAVILQTKHIKKGGFLGLFAKNMVEVVAANDINLPTNQSKKPLIKSIPGISTKSRERELTGDIKQLQNGIEQVKNMLKHYIQQNQSSTEAVDLPPALKIIGPNTQWM